VSQAQRKQAHDVSTAPSGFDSFLAIPLHPAVRDTYRWLCQVAVDGIVDQSRVDIAKGIRVGSLQTVSNDVKILGEAGHVERLESPRGRMRLRVKLPVGQSIGQTVGQSHGAETTDRTKLEKISAKFGSSHPKVYFASKAVVFSVVGLVQMLLLLLVVALSTHGYLGFFAESTEKELSRIPSLGLFALLWSSYLGALAIGLAASSLARTEATAVASLPLLLMPQLLLSAVATGVSEVPYDQPRAFRPLVVTLRDPHSGPPEFWMIAVDCASMFCIARPAVLLVEPRQAPGYRSIIWLADMVHLLLLLCVSWGIAYLKEWLCLKSL
jgi:hypothetical protein